MIDLRLGDCLDILPNLPDMCADAIITDVPYGTTACKWDVIIPLDKMWAQVKRLCKGAFVTTSSQPFTSVLIMSNLDWFKYEWVWDKVNQSGHLNAKKMPLKQHENVLVFSKNKHTYNPQMYPAPKWSRGRYAINRSKGTSKDGVYGIKKLLDSEGAKLAYPKSIINVGGTRQADKIHPTQKSIKLYEYLIKTYTNPGDVVLDFCMGSGTTGVACVNTGRSFIGIEKERDYFEIASRRINGQPANEAGVGLEMLSPEGNENIVSQRRIHEAQQMELV
jgi:site-specific DNA-methyltransferase (adenine-specific)